MVNERVKEIAKIVSLPVLIASLCCLSPLILVLLGISTATFAASLSDTLYGTYKWAFRGVGLLLLAIALWYHFRKKGICTLDVAKRRRNEIINTTLIVLGVAVVGYIVWLYGVVEIVGIWLNIW